LFYGGGTQQLWRQIVGAFSVAAYSALGTAVVALIVKYTVGLRLGAEVEASGVDEALHAESGYDFGAVGGPVPIHPAEERRANETDHRDRQAIHVGGHQDWVGTSGAAGHDG
jgi:Amt family ammonium transporter